MAFVGKAVNMSPSVVGSTLLCAEGLSLANANREIILPFAREDEPFSAPRYVK